MLAICKLGVTFTAQDEEEERFGPLLVETLLQHGIAANDVKRLKVGLHRFLVLIQAMFRLRDSTLWSLLSMLQRRSWWRSRLPKVSSILKMFQNRAWVNRRLTKFSWRPRSWSVLSCLQFWFSFSYFLEIYDSQDVKVPMGFTTATEWHLMRSQTIQVFCWN